MNTNDLKKMQKELEQLKLEVALMKRLSTKIGFIYSYLELLKYHKCKKEAFNILNDHYRILFGKKLFINYTHFTNCKKSIMNQ